MIGDWLLPNPLEICTAWELIKKKLETYYLWESVLWGMSSLPLIFSLGRTLLS